MTGLHSITSPKAEGVLSGCQDPTADYWESFFQRHKAEICQALKVDKSEEGTVVMESLESQVSNATLPMCFLQSVLSSRLKVVFGTLIHMHLKLESSDGPLKSDV